MALATFVSDLAPETFAMLGGFIASGWFGALVTKFSKKTGTTGFLFRAFAKGALGFLIYEGVSVAEEKGKIGDMEKAIGYGVSAGAIASIVVDALNTFTGLRLMADEEIAAGLEEGEIPVLEAEEYSMLEEGEYPMLEEGEVEPEVIPEELAEGEDIEPIVLEAEEEKRRPEVIELSAEEEPIAIEAI